MTRALQKIYGFILIVILLASGVLAEKTGLIAYVIDPYEYPLMIRFFWQHVCIVIYSMTMATVIGLVAGIILTRKRYRKFAGVVMYIIGLGQTIPSLAVLALAMSFLGIGTKPAVFALTVYSILPIARNTLAGITAVPPAMIDAGRGMGMPSWRILFEIELPNAMKVILTGFRIAMVINIGTATLAFLIGAGGLGDLIFSGISLMRTDQLLAGAIPVTLMALVADFLCEVLGFLLISKGLRLAEEK